MTATHYVAHIAGKVVATRKSSIPASVKTYTHAVAVWGHGKTEHVVTWCSRFDLAQGERRKYERAGYTAHIVPVMVMPKAAKKGQLMPAPATSWKVEVQADSTGTWAGNAMRYATKAAAEDAARDLEWRWLAVRDWRVVESQDPVNTVDQAVEPRTGAGSLD